jgi:hypothetical protein
MDYKKDAPGLVLFAHPMHPSASSWRSARRTDRQTRSLAHWPWLSVGGCLLGFEEGQHDVVYYKLGD